VAAQSRQSVQRGMGSGGSNLPPVYRPDLHVRDMLGLRPSMHVREERRRSTRVQHVAELFLITSAL
jgi:hypothetical protein